ncbi:ankyrin repeat domain-containing protein [Synechocystis sp. PCC 7339]|uniref:ankyrin repeat domain-containing protein n=1 Tax=unclassified Synechocystis TaxID=2640012 RepID=UPI001BB02090|nr:MULTISPECIES: ankyrin repeat domain-containing protein [unclassified Synechocystis]QUS62233.1 ankyrin repeat domain-containing protein [Synechocystis sp. PCC 7338]UAJ71416.1 ankyrin repeat domain-containing protein [Synechocystis sp. PCC 7339]
MINPILAAAQQSQWQLVGQYLSSVGPAQLDQGDAKGLTALMYGVAALEMTTVKQLLQAGADPNRSRPPHGITPLMLLAGLQYHPNNSEKNLDQQAIAKLLIKAGADLNQGNDDRTTTLMMAAYRNNEPLVKILLEAGADPNLQDDQGTTALEWAIKQENLAMVTALLEWKVDLGLTDGEGNLPLTLAMGGGNEAIIGDLIRAGACGDAESWFTAVEEGNTFAVQALIEAGYPPAQMGEMGDTALHIACLEGYGQMVQALLQEQVPLDLANQAGDTPLQLAIAQGHVDIVAQLLNAGADSNFSGNGEPPLLTALTASHGDAQTQAAIVDALGRAGVDLDQTLWEGKTPLMLAAMENLSAVVTTIADYAVQVNRGDPSGSTALMWACHRGHQSAVQTLLANFPALDANLKNQGGQTALDLARLNRHGPIVALLESYISRSA